MNLLDFYRKVLDYLSFETDDAGNIFVSRDSKTIPITIGGRRWVLPTDNQLKDVDNKTTLVFHPLREPMVGNETEVLEALREAINTVLNLRVGMLGGRLLQLAASTKQHPQFDPDQMTLPIQVPGADETSAQHWQKILMQNVKVNRDKVVVNIFLRKGGRVNEVRYARVGITSFPMWREIEKDSESIYGIKVRPKDKILFKQVLKYIFPDIEDAEAYNRGSDSKIAPWFEALMSTALNLSLAVNEVAKRFESHLINPETIIFDESWLEAMEHLDRFSPEIRRIPMQGSPNIPEPPPTPPPAPPANYPAPVGYPAPPPYPGGAPVAAPPQPPGIVKTGSGKLDTVAMRGALPPGAYPPPYGGGYPPPDVPAWQQPGYALASPPVYQPGYPAGYPQPAQYPAHTNPYPGGYQVPGRI